MKKNKSNVILLIIILFVANYFLITLTQRRISATTCMTVAQVQSDARCLYIWSGQVYYPGPNSPHHGHPCNTDVGGVPGSHTQTPAAYLTNFYIANICPAISPTPLPTPPPNTFFITNSQTVPFLPSIGLQVTPGTTVTWINKDTVAHSVTEIGYPQKPDSFNSGMIQPGQSFSHTFTYEAKFPFFNENNVGPGFLNVFNLNAPTPSPIPFNTLTIGSYPISQIMPRNVTIYKGTTVTFINNDSHSSPQTEGFTSITGSPAFTTGQLQLGQSKQITFANPGTYTYNGTGDSINANLTVVNGTTPNTSPTPTSTTNPSTTPNPNGITFSLTMFLHGIFHAGDNINPNGTGNMQPAHTQRAVTLNIINATGVSIAQAQGTINANAANGNFTGTVSVNTIPNGQYTITLASPSFLRKLVPGFQQINGSNLYTLPSVTLTAGDINNDGQIDVSDYNLLVNCFGSKQQLPSCTNATASDLNDDGLVNGIDYNLFLREMSVQKGL